MENDHHQHQHQHVGTITVRIIKSFEYKNFRTLVFPNLLLEELNLTKLEEAVWEKVRNTPGLKIFENCKLDTFKLYYHAHGAKTNNPMINVGGDAELVYKDYETPLYSLGFRNESEVSYFKREDYENYKQNPTHKW